jgi:hypothetical protein
LERLIGIDMATIIIEENSPQAKQLLEYIKTLPFATVIEEKKKSFRQALEECNAVPVSVFVGELHRQINEHFDKNA